MEIDTVRVDRLRRARRSQPKRSTGAPIRAPANGLMRVGVRQVRRPGRGEKKKNMKKNGKRLSPLTAGCSLRAWNLGTGIALGAMCNGCVDPCSIL